MTDENEIVKDGEHVRVPYAMMDATQQGVSGQGVGTLPPLGGGKLETLRDEWKKKIENLWRK